LCSKDKTIKVNEAEKANESYCFFHSGWLFIDAAEHLFEYVSNGLSQDFIFPARFLCHHGIELTLKAYAIWEKLEYKITHKLLDLAYDVSFLEMSEECKNLLKKIDTFFNDRYPMDITTYRRIDKVHEGIKDEVAGVGKVYPGEASSMDWEKVKQLHKFLIDSMPPRFQESLVEQQNKDSIDLSKIGIGP
jgi:HEPN domain-containing protein